MKIWVLVTKTHVYFPPASGRLAKARAHHKAFEILRQIQSEINEPITIALVSSTEAFSEAEELQTQIQTLPQLAAATLDTLPLRLVEMLVVQHDFQPKGKLFVLEAVEQELWLHQVEVADWSIDTRHVEGFGPAAELRLVISLLKEECDRILSLDPQIRKREELLLEKHAVEVIAGLHLGIQQFEIKLLERQMATSTEMYRRYLEWYDRFLAQIKKQLSQIESAYRVVLVGDIFRVIQYDTRMLKQAGLTAGKTILDFVQDDPEAIVTSLQEDLQDESEVVEQLEEPDNEAEEDEGAADANASSPLDSAIHPEGQDDAGQPVEDPAKEKDPKEDEADKSQENSSGSINGAGKGKTSESKPREGSSQRNVGGDIVAQGFFSLLLRSGNDYYVQYHHQGHAVNQKFATHFKDECNCFQALPVGCFAQYKEVPSPSGSPEVYKLNLNSSEWISLRECIQLLEKVGPVMRLVYAHAIAKAIINMLINFYRNDVQDKLPDARTRESSALHYLHEEAILVEMDPRGGEFWKINEPRICLWTLGFRDKVKQDDPQIHQYLQLWMENTGIDLPQHMKSSGNQGAKFDVMALDAIMHNVSGNKDEGIRNPIFLKRLLKEEEFDNPREVFQNALSAGATNIWKELWDAIFG